MANLGYIQVTRLCNQECRFCSNPPNKNTLSYEEGIKEIEYFMNQGYDGVIFTGGEPTLSEYLPKFIKYCHDKNIPSRIITNGQRIADYNYLKTLKEAGLNHIGLSIYSIKPKIQTFLTNNPDSLKNIIKALYNLERINGITVDIITVINKYNSDHLSENVKFLVKNFYFLKHFIWNNLDPTMNRAAQNIDTIPRLIDFEVELKKATDFLTENNRTFRVERVPLCYMDGFEHTSTETRKIVKGEKRTTFFLDKRRLIIQKNFYYNKDDCCKICQLNKICAGLYEMDKYYSKDELYPIFKDEELIKKKIIE